MLMQGESEITKSARDFIGRVSQGVKGVASSFVWLPSRKD